MKISEGKSGNVECVKVEKNMNKLLEHLKFNQMVDMEALMEI